MSKSPITLGERLIVGILSAVIVGLMAVCMPFGLVLISRGRGLGMLGAYGTFHIWGSSVILASGLAGAVLGFDRMAILFGHLWGTEEPQNRGITVALWALLLGIGGLSYWIGVKHHML